MPLRIPQQAQGTDQFMESVTNTNTREEQVVRLGGSYPITATTGTITAAMPSATTDVTAGRVVSATTVDKSLDPAGTCMIAIYGTYAAGMVFTFEALNNAGGNTLWMPIAGARVDTGKLETTTGTMPASTATSAPVAWRFPVARVQQIRVRASTFTSATSLNVIIDPAVPPGEPVVNAIINNPPNAQLVSYTATNAAYTITTEALRSLVGTRNLAAATTATSQTVPTGKTFRILGFNASVRQGAVTSALAISFNLRAVPAGGSLSITSPVVANLGISVTNVVGATGSAGGQLGQFLELPSGAIWGVSDLSSATSAGTTVWVTVNGIEY